MNDIREQFTRTACACAGCVAACKSMPGALIPGDAERIHEFLKPAAPLQQWAETSLLASAGALIMAAGKLQRVPSLVLAQKADGACVFLDENDRCAVHAVSPFGCAYTDIHVGPVAGAQISRAIVLAQMQGHAAGGTYPQLIAHLVSAGKLAAPLKERRGKFEAALTAIACKGR